MTCTIVVVAYHGALSAVIDRLTHSIGSSYATIFDAYDDQFVAVLYESTRVYGTYIAPIFGGIEFVFDKVHTVSLSIPIHIVVNLLQL